MTTTATVSLSSPRTPKPRPEPRWRVAAVEALYAQPFMNPLLRAQQVQRENFDAHEMQLSTLQSIKTDGCAEDCGYCPRSAHVDAGANSIFYGDKLLTTSNPQAERDRALFERLGLRARGQA